MYSSDWSAGYCMPCSRCGRAVTVERNCSSTHDYKCGDCIEGYYGHPNLPNTCIKCSYCYPDNPGVTVIVDECLTKSKDPAMRCMPVTGGKLTGSFAKSRAHSSTPSTSTTTMPTDHVISYLYDDSRNVLIPPEVATALIIVCVILIIIILGVLCVLHKRKQLPKKSETINFLGKLCGCKGSTLKRKYSKDIPSHDLKSKQIEFIFTSEPGATKDPVSRRQAYDDEVPLVSCNECLIHYGIGGGSDSNQSVDLVIGQNETRDETRLRESCIVELDVERACPSPGNILLNDSDSNCVSSCENDLPLFRSASDHECGKEDSGRQLFTNNNGFECEEALVTHPNPPAPLPEKKERNQGGSIPASELLPGAPGGSRMVGLKPSDAGSYDSDDSGLPCVQQEAAESIMSDLNADVAPRLVRRLDSGIAEKGADTESLQNSSRHHSTALQTGACLVPDVHTSRDPQQPGGSSGDVSTDSEGSSSRSVMSRDYDSEVDKKTLLDRGQTSPVSAGRRPGRLKKKTRRHSNPGAVGFRLNSETQESYSKLDTFTPRV